MVGLGQECRNEPLGDRDPRHSRPDPPVMTASLPGGPLPVV